MEKKSKIPRMKSPNMDENSVNAQLFLVFQGIL